MVNGMIGEGPALGGSFLRPGARGAFSVAWQSLQHSIAQPQQHYPRRRTTATPLSTKDTKRHEEGQQRLPNARNPAAHFCA